LEHKTGIDLTVPLAFKKLYMFYFETFEKKQQIAPQRTQGGLEIIAKRLKIKPV